MAVEGQVIEGGVPGARTPAMPAVGPAPTRDAAEIDRARGLFEAQLGARWRLAARGASERIARIRALRDAIERRREELFEAIRGDFGKHPVETEVTELQPVLVELAHTIRHLARWMRPRRVGTPLLLAGTRSEVRPEPKGRVLVLSPWNYPFYLAVNPLAGAVAAGNTVILRPSDKVPRTSRFLQSLVAEVFPEDEAAVVLGGHAVADALLELPFDHVFFTGSTAVGKKVMAAAARHLASVTLELGGKSPAFVDESANVRDAAARITWGKFVNAGQTCVAPDYVLVAASRQQELVEALKARIAAQYGASAADRAQSPDYCRIVDRGSAERLARVLREAVERGARVEIGGDVDVGGRYVAPTVLTNVGFDSPAMQAEIFGPILPVIPYRDVGEALAFVRSRPKPLALYVFAARRRAVERIVAGTTAGGTSVNHVLIHLANPDLPFGGVGDSGLGSYHGEHGFRAFSHERAVLVQGRPALTDRLVPPYRAGVRRLVALARRVIR